MHQLEELMGVDARSILLAASIFSALVAGVLTWPICAMMFVFYRRSVTRGMRLGRTAGNAPPAPDTPPAPTPAYPHSWIALEPFAPAPPAPLALRARATARREAGVLAGAGLVFGIGSDVTYHVVADLEIHPVRTITLILLLGWVVVPAVLSMGITRLRTKILVWTGFLVVVVLLPVAAGADLAEVLAEAAVVVLIPGLYIIATSLRPIRGAAWLVLPALAALTMAALMLYLPVVYLQVGVAFDKLVWTMILGAVGLLMAVALYAVMSALVYARKWIGDETLLILQWWVVLAATQALLLGTQGLTTFLLGLAPLAVMGLFLTVVALRRLPHHEPPVRLLLLRTFGARRRSSRLLRDLTVQWRWVGSVELITGADLATETLEPDEFLDFLLGRLRRRFVRTPDDVQVRLHGLDLRPDRDGRYRINEILCQNDTWRAALECLVGSVDAVLIDLRGFSAERVGVVHEIERLVALLPLRRVVALTDASTDFVVLRRVLDRAAALAPDDAPLHDDVRPALRTVPVTSRRADTDALMRAVAHAATAGGPAEVNT